MVVEAAVRLITGAVGQAGNSWARCQAAPNLCCAKSCSEPSLPPRPPLFLVTHAANLQQQMAVPGKCTCVANRLEVSQH